MVMADSLSAQSVGREFVKQYYTMLNQAPNFLHRFYSNNSSFVHSAIDLSGEDQTVIVGQQDIHKKIMSLNFQDCHAKIRQVDSQASVADGVIIQVIGELSNDGGPMHPFVQTFVLVAQSPRKYYVHNDIFRYLSQVMHDKPFSTANTLSTVDVGHTEEGCNGTMEPTEDHLHETATYYRQPSPADLQHISNGNNHLDIESDNVQAEFEHTVEVPAATPSEEAVTNNSMEINDPEQPDTATVAVVDVPTEDQCVPESVPEEIKIEPVEEKPAEIEAVAVPDVEVPVETEPKVVKPVTWAAMASKTPVSAPANRPAQPPVRVVKAQPAAVRPSSDTKSETSHVTSSALPQRSPRPNTKEEPVEQEVNRIPADNDESRRPQIPQQNYPDSQQIFVGNLPQYLSDKDLREFFSQFGEVIEMKINRKSGNLNNLPYFGFVVFEQADMVQKVLANRPLFLNGNNGKHRINVEEKKPRAELQASRPRSASRGGARPTGAYGRGSDMYSRGPSRPGGSNASSTAGENVRNSAGDESHNGVA